MNQSFTIIPNRLKEYVEFLNKTNNKLNLNQSTIEKGYLRLGESWNDKIYNTTGMDLAELAKITEKVYASISSTVIVATKYYNAYVDAQGYKEFLPQRKAEVFVSVLKGEKFMDSNFYKGNVTDLDVMKKFITDLGNYILDTDNIMRSLKKEYEIIGKERAWDAPQYKQLGNVLYSVDGKITNQLQRLELCRKMTEISYNKLVELSKVRF